MFLHGKQIVSEFNVNMKQADLQGISYTIHPNSVRIFRERCRLGVGLKDNLHPLFCFISISYIKMCRGVGINNKY